jgi:hypothetical protein
MRRGHLLGQKQSLESERRVDNLNVENDLQQTD